MIRGIIWELVYNFIHIEQWDWTHVVRMAELKMETIPILSPSDKQIIAANAHAHAQVAAAHAQVVAEHIGVYESSIKQSIHTELANQLEIRTRNLANVNAERFDVWGKNLRKQVYTEKLSHIHWMTTQVNHCIADASLSDGSLTRLCTWVQTQLAK